jgi:hypothetical protein
MTTNEKTEFGLTPNSAHEKPPTTPSSMTEGTPRGKSTREAPLPAELRAAFDVPPWLP